MLQEGLHKGGTCGLYGDLVGTPAAIRSRWLFGIRHLFVLFVCNYQVANLQVHACSLFTRCTVESSDHEMHVQT